MNKGEIGNVQTYDYALTLGLTLALRRCDSGEEGGVHLQRGMKHRRLSIIVNIRCDDSGGNTAIRLIQCALTND